MAPDNLLPDNDQDLQLAQLLERTRSMGESVQEIKDPIIPLLLQFRNAEKADLSRQLPNSSAIWTRIEVSLQTEQTSVYHLLSRSNILRWAAAAAAVFIVLSTFYWLFETSQPDLIANSGSTTSTITLDDGSTVTLRPYSSLFEVSQSSTEQVYSISGEAYFEVVNNPNRTFITETDEGRVIVLGTKFILQNKPNRTSVFLEEGRVRLETFDESFFALLEPGEFSTIADDSITEPVQQNSRIHKDWLENVLVLENQRVSLVFSEIEQHFNVSINARNAPEETLGGSIQLDSLEQVLEDLSVVLGGTFEQTGENSYEYIPDN